MKNVQYASAATSLPSVTTPDSTSRCVQPVGVGRRFRGPTTLPTTANVPRRPTPGSLAPPHHSSSSMRSDETRWRLLPCTSPMVVRAVVTTIGLVQGNSRQRVSSERIELDEW